MLLNRLTDHKAFNRPDSSLKNKSMIGRRPDLGLEKI